MVKPASWLSMDGASKERALRWTLGLVAALGCWLWSEGASAQPEPQRAEAPRLEERTAYTVGAQRLKLGVLNFEYGITDSLAVGIDPPAWAARAVLPILVPNLHGELVVYEREPLAVSLRMGAYYADLRGVEGAGGSLFAVPTSLFGSLRLAPRWWFHGEAMYVWANAFGTGDFDNADLNGAVATRAVQLGGMLEWKLTRVLSLTALGRAQVYSTPLIFDTTISTDPRTSVDIEAELETRSTRPWHAIGGAALLWEKVRLVLGVGYGNYFIPGASIALPSRWVFPDLSLAVVL